jgi:hypothetical protein
MAGEPLPSYNISLDGQPSARWPARNNVTENISQVLLVRKVTFFWINILTSHATVPDQQPFHGLSFPEHHTTYLRQSFLAIPRPR